MRREAGRIAFLDYLRTFAFVSVLIGHRFYDTLLQATKDQTVHVTIRTIVEALLPFFWAGGAGVVIFFLISGYIIVKVASEEEATAFVVKRIFRIYPLYVLAVALQVALDAAVGGKPIPAVGTLTPSFLLLGDIFGTPYSLGGVEWTLRLEMLFYAIVALLKWGGVLKRPTLLLGAFLAVTLLVELVGPLPTSFGWSDGYITFFLPFLFVGSTLYLLERRVNAVLAVSYILYVWSYYLLMLPGVNARGAGSHFLTLACLLFLAAWHFRARFPYTPIVVGLADLAYSVYLFHNWLWDYVVVGARAWWPYLAASKLAVLAIVLVACLALSRLVEKPAIRLGNGLLKRRAPVPGP